MGLFRAAHRFGEGGTFSEICNTFPKEDSKNVRNLDIDCIFTSNF